jgi:hypothetical protein
MDIFLLIAAFFTGLFLLFVFGRFVGHIMGLDDYVNYKPDSNPGEKS